MGNIAALCYPTPQIPTISVLGLKPGAGNTYSDFPVGGMNPST